MFIGIYVYTLFFSSLLHTIINKVTSRKCRYCDTVLSNIPRIVRCFDCHKKYIDNAMISNQNDSKDKKMILIKNILL